MAFFNLKSTSKDLSVSLVIKTPTGTPALTATACLIFALPVFAASSTSPTTPIEVNLGPPTTIDSYIVEYSTGVSQGKVSPAELAEIKTVQKTCATGTNSAAWKRGADEARTLKFTASMISVEGKTYGNPRCQGLKDNALSCCQHGFKAQETAIYNALEKQFGKNTQEPANPIEASWRRGKAIGALNCQKSDADSKQFFQAGDVCPAPPNKNELSYLGAMEIGSSLGLATCGAQYQKDGSPTLTTRPTDERVCADPTPSTGKGARTPSDRQTPASGTSDAQTIEGKF